MLNALLLNEKRNKVTRWKEMVCCFEWSKPQGVPMKKPGTNMVITMQGQQISVGNRRPLPLLYCIPARGPSVKSTCMHPTF